MKPVEEVELPPSNLPDQITPAQAAADCRKYYDQSMRSAGSQPGVVAGAIDKTGSAPPTGATGTPNVMAPFSQQPEDLIDQLFNSTEKRLARTLLFLARYGKKDEPQKVLANISQEALAEMIGTTRSRVNLFMNKFKKLGFIHTNGGLHINSSLLSVVLHD